MKVVEKNVIGFYAFLEKHKSKIKRTLKTREQIEKELDKDEKEKIKKLTLEQYKQYKQLKQLKE